MNCPICDHPPHDGHRCLHPITRDVSEMGCDGIIFTRLETVSNCACGMVDELMRLGQVPQLR